MSGPELIRRYILAMKGVDIGGIAEPVTTLQWALYYQAVAIATDWWQSNNK
jgi:hypothetical protein